MHQLSILVSGAGIAGPVLAHFLSQAGHKVTVVERAPCVRTGGQNVDIRGHGLTTLRRMGVEEAIRSKTTHEKGLRFVDASNQSWADFPAGKGEGFTSDIEIMRGDLARVLYEASRTNVEYVFGDCVKSIREDAGGIEVDFENGMASKRVDVLVGADGWASRTRKLVYGPEVSREAVKDLGQWAAWFTITHQESDSDWARWYNAQGKRMILLRPDNANISRASLWIMPSDDHLDAVAKEEVASQKAAWKAMFKEAGWEAERVVDGMEAADDFYMQKIAQVKMPSWSSGRTVLVGDAAYCPSPISGMGTTVAIVGAYVLAGELARSPENVETAFRAYEKRMKKFIGVAQKLAPGAPSMANPQTSWGITVLHLFLGFVAWTGILSWMGASFNPPAKAMDLPQYELGDGK